SRSVPDVPWEVLAASTPHHGDRSDRSDRALTCRPQRTMLDLLVGEGMLGSRVCLPLAASPVALGTAAGATGCCCRRRRGRRRSPLWMTWDTGSGQGEGGSGLESGAVACRENVGRAHF